MALIIFDKKGHAAMEELLTALNDLYRDNLNLVVELSVKAPEPIGGMFEKLIKLNVAEREVIAREYKRFFPKGGEH